ncbi:MAG: (4Fe-4S)-binding protein [Nitrospirae bacterium GWD2_57_9]|nr:MAG: (4Fe-4S)-binding protein [Nitrospirae bacterium GWD2_57_9]OGW47843.1 MAG: (4Fe-4S)-binding protein [Nitrospirae bacterium GWC2_57_9]
MKNAIRFFKVQNVRRAVQAAFLLLFLFLFIQTESKGSDELGYPVRLFLDFDPLILVTTLLSAHAVAKAFALSLVTIMITVVLGRVFCGWVCPLGTLNNLVGSIRPRRPAVTYAPWYRVKYYLLIGTLASALFSLQPAGIMDPLSLLIRSFSVSVYPLFNYTVRSVFDTIFRIDPLGLASLTEPVYSVLKKTVLSFEQASYRQGVFIGMVFFTVLGLNLVEKRFWCKYLCPLGAFLGLLSRRSLLKRTVSEGCTSCGACAAVCQGNASPEAKERWRDAECMVCRNCDDICPQNAVSFGFSPRRKAAGLDLGRRRVIGSALSGIAAVPLLRAVPLVKTGAQDPLLLRPPGSLEEKEFLKRCVRCGECMKVCTTNGLQPTLLEAGVEGIWSPLLVPRIGYCEYRCTLCGQVCPTGAIKKLKLEEKIKVRIGLAMIDKGRCLPWAHARPCIVCEEVCPTSKKAIWFESAKVRDRQGKPLMVKQPYVDLELCIGCGICEAKCPVLGRPAISVTSVGESRSRENQLLIPGTEAGY